MLEGLNLAIKDREEAAVFVYARMSPPDYYVVLCPSDVPDALGFASTVEDKFFNGDRAHGCEMLMVGLDAIMIFRKDMISAADLWKELEGFGMDPGAAQEGKDIIIPTYANDGTVSCGMKRLVEILTELYESGKAMAQKENNDQHL